MKGQPIALRVSRNTILGNTILFIFKLLAGIVANSAAMVSDAVHTASDILSTLVVIIGIKLSGKESDEQHQYGHERMECVAALLLAAVLCATGIVIGYNGFAKIITSKSSQLAAPGGLALIAAVASIFAKEAMYWYTRNAAKKVGSGAMMADAWHHRSDALSSVGSFAGILGAKLGFPVLDSVASIIICVFIVKVSVDIFMDSISKMTDRACDVKVVEEMRQLIWQQHEVIGIKHIMTRLFGNKIYVDIELYADGNATLYETFEISQKIHDIIENNFPKVKHCTVRLIPKEEKEDEKNT